MKAENFTKSGQNDSINYRLNRFVGKKENLTFRFIQCFLIFTLFTFAVQVQAQCPMACNNNIQVSLDEGCIALITPDMLLEGDYEDDCPYFVELYDLSDNPIPNPVTDQWVDQIIKGRVNLGVNSCWGYILIEDKKKPEITCLPDITIYCEDDAPDPMLEAAVDDNCEFEIEIVILSDEVDDYNCVEDDKYSAARVITYVAVDGSGNQSEECVLNILYKRRDVSEVDFPPDYNDAEGEKPSLECDGKYRDEGGQLQVWDSNGNGYPDPEETGVPTIDGVPVYPNDTFCELNVTHTDQRIDICPQSFKILRKWTILDWCTPTNDPEVENPREDYQIIKVLDTKGPVASCPPDFTVSADPYTCTADILMPAPFDISDCSKNITYSIALLFADDDGDPPLDGMYEGDDNIIPADEQMYIYDFPFGRTWVRYTLYDECGNTGECFIEVDVIDEVAPVAVCDYHTIVSLTSQNQAHVYAETFDDGSHDNCTDVTFKVKRMDGDPCNGINNPNSVPFADYVEFCCDDLGETIMVILEVTDEFENKNTCMVEVTVQDKIDPVIDCPDDVTIDCTQNYKNLNLTGGYATGFDNCDVTISYEDFGSLDECNVGHIRREWTAKDPGNRTDVCDQWIKVKNLTPLTVSNSWWATVPNRTLTGCVNVDTDPSKTGYPSVPDDACSMVAKTFSDQTFEFVEGACLKILRTWTVIDWCQFDQNYPQNGGLWQYTQVIKVNNDEAPVPTCDDITIKNPTGECTGKVIAVASATDECTPEDELIWTYKVDAFNDNNPSNDPISFTGTGNVFSRDDVPFGTHKLKWTVRDRCGNVSTCNQIFTVEDTKPPTPYCLGGITTVLMQHTDPPFVTIWGEDFDLNSEDNCDGPLDFKIKPVGAGGNPQSSWTFYCGDVGPIDIEIWVFDVAGNSDYCNTKISIQANNNICGSEAEGSTLMIAGDITRDDLTTVEDVNVMLENMQPSVESYYTTDSDGHYEFHNVESASDYEVTASKEDNYTNGVSTLDLVLIQKHILGITPFNNPYNAIAADANNNQSVSATDMVLLRKLILGLIDELPNNESWRFVDASQEFEDDNFPWPFNEVISIEQLLDTDMNNDFKAVKIGDVNSSAVANSLIQQSSQIRSNDQLTLRIEDQKINAGEMSVIPVFASDFEGMVGFQFTLNLHQTNLQSVNIVPGALEMNESNYALHGDHISFSWNDIEGVEILGNEPLFSIQLQVSDDVELSELLSIGSEITQKEAYDQNLDATDIQLDIFENVKPEFAGEKIQLLQNRPNPFSSETTIEFTLPENSDASLSVYDIHGKLLKVYSGEFVKGYNSILISRAELYNAQGVLYYQLESNGVTYSKKMILMY